MNLRKLTSKRCVSQKLSHSKRREAPSICHGSRRIRAAIRRLKVAIRWQLTDGGGNHEVSIKMIVQTINSTWNLKLFSWTSSENWIKFQMIQLSKDLFSAIVSYNTALWLQGRHMQLHEFLLDTSWLQTSVEMQLRWSGSAYQQPEQWWCMVFWHIQKQPSNPKCFMNAIPKKTIKKTLDYVINQVWFSKNL